MNNFATSKLLPQMMDIAALKNGSEDAFVSMYQSFHNKVYRYFLKKVKSGEVAKDLTQQAFIKLWQGRKTLSDTHSGETQIFTIANSVFLDHLRKRTNENKHQSLFIDDIDNKQLPIEHSCQAFETSNYLHAAMDQLPPVRKKITTLRIMHGLSNKEIANLLSISSKTVEDHITKAFRHMRSAALLF